MVRWKRRYIVLETSGIKNSRHLKESIIEAVKQQYGDYGLSTVTPALQVKYESPGTNIFIVRAGKGPHMLVSSVLPFIKTCRGGNITTRSLHVAGTIRQSNKFLKTYHEQQLKIEERQVKKS